HSWVPQYATNLPNPSNPIHPIHPNLKHTPDIGHVVAFTAKFGMRAIDCSAAVRLWNFLHTEMLYTRSRIRLCLSVQNRIQNLPYRDNFVHFGLCSLFTSFLSRTHSKNDMQLATKMFQYVDYLWDKDKEAALGDDEIALLIYRSNILGADLRITNYGGGNTSCKTTENDPLTGKPVEVMWVKGSGGDIGTLTRKGLAGLYLDKLRALKNVYRGLEFEDEMVNLFNHGIFDLDSKAPSIDTPLHAFLPFKHIDHLHPDAAIAIAASKDGEAITRELFDNQIAWVPWQRPGFDLGLQLEKAVNENPGIRGIMLGGHGLFTWGDTSYECYINSLEVIDKASAYLNENYGKRRPVFGGVELESLDPDARRKQASRLAPVLRGLASAYAR